MTSAQGSQAEASSLASKQQNELNLQHRGSNSALTTSLFVTSPDLQDEDRLVAIKSTAVALQKEEELLQKRIEEKGVLRKLEDTIAKHLKDVEEAQEAMAFLHRDKDTAIKACADDKVAAQQQLRIANDEVKAVTIKHDNLAAKLASREGALSDCQARNTQLVEEVVSYRAQTHEMSGTIAAYRGQIAELDAYARRAAEENSRLKQKSASQDALIDSLRKEVDYYGDKNVKLPSHNMHGPVGGPRGAYPHYFYQSYPPTSSSTGPHPYPSTSMATYSPASAEMPTAYPPAPAGTFTSSAATSYYAPAPTTYSRGPVHRNGPHMPHHTAEGDDVKGSEGCSEGASGAGPQSPGAFSIAPRGSDYASPQDRLSSSNRSDATQSGDSFYTAQGNDDRAQIGDVHSETEPTQELTQEFSFSHSLKESPVDLGSAFLAKLQKKELGNTSTNGTSEDESNTLSAVHPDPVTMPAQAPSSVTQASENGATQEEATLAESGYISEEAAGGVGGGDASKAEVSDRHEAAASHVATLDAAEAVAVAAEVPAAVAAPPPLPRKDIYVTPLHPGYLPGLPAEQQQAYRDALQAVSLSHPPAALDMTGVYVTPMPTAGTQSGPGNCSSGGITPPIENGQSGASEIKEQRANRRSSVKNIETSSVKQNDSSDGGQNAHTTDALQQDQGTAQVQSPEEKMQVNEALSKHAKKKAKKERRKRAGHKGTATDNERTA